MVKEEEILKYGAKHASVVVIITILFVCLFACSTDQCGRKTDQPGRLKGWCRMLSSGMEEIRKRRKSSYIRPSLLLMLLSVCLFRPMRSRDRPTRKTEGVVLHALRRWWRTRRKSPGMGQSMSLMMLTFSFVCLFCRPMRPQDRPTRKTKRIVSHAVLRGGGKGENPQSSGQACRCYFHMSVCLFACSSDKCSCKTDLPRGPERLCRTLSYSNGGGGTGNLCGAKDIIVIVIIIILFVCLFACSTDQFGRKTDQPRGPERWCRTLSSSDGGGGGGGGNPQIWGQARHHALCAGLPLHVGRRSYHLYRVLLHTVRWSLLVSTGLEEWWEGTRKGVLEGP